jgi:hypothetical protein
MMTGCGKGDHNVDRVLASRQKLLNANGCTFYCEIVADYGDSLYTFGMNCSVDKAGNLDFTVKEPDSIAGITGNISSKQAHLTFDDQVLLFEMMADGQVTPVSGPWLLMKALRSGYISACSMVDNGVQVYIQDSYEEDALMLEVSLTSSFIPELVQIVFDGKRILSLRVENFKIV